MKNVFRLLIFALFTATMFSCEIEVGDDDLNSNDELLEITVESVSTDNSITVKWIPVEECSWYSISYAKTGQELIKETDYQDLNNDTLSYELSGLDSNTEYEIKLDGKDYLYGGTKLATQTITASTNP